MSNAKSKENLTGCPFYTNEQIQREVKSVAERINKDWEGYTQACGYGHPLYLCLLSGGAPFFHDLIKYLEPGYVGYISACSYGNSKVPGANTSVKVDFASIPDDVDINRVLIIDDICDSGKTLEKVTEKVRKIVDGVGKCLRSDRSVDVPIETCVLLNRIMPGELKFEPNYSAIGVDNNYFFAGYGLDDEGLMRNLPYIYVCGRADD